METLLQRYLIEFLTGGVILLAAISVNIGLLAIVLGRRAQLEAWKSFAGRMGLRLERGGLLSAPRVVGEIKGRAFNMMAIGGSEDDPKRTRMEMSVANPHFARLTLERDGKLLRAVDRALHGESIKTGDAAFDDKITAHGDPPELAASALADSTLREQLTRLKGGARIKLVDKTLSFWGWGVERNVDTLTIAAETLSGLADRIDGWQPPPGWGVKRIDTRR